MSIPVFPTKKDGDLALWAAGFFAKINANPATYGLTLPQAAGFGALNTAYQSAYAASQNPNTNSKQQIIAKNQAREDLLSAVNGARQLVGIVQAFPGTTNAMRGELGLRIPDVEPTPVPVPTVAPDLSIVSQSGRTARLRLRDAENPDSRGKPDGVVGFTILYHVGDEPPFVPQEWTLLIQHTRTLVDLEFPVTIQPGVKVWLTAYWYNTKAQTSPAAEAVMLRIGDTLAEVA
jgi:hypothetical protein